MSANLWSDANRSIPPFNEGCALITGGQPARAADKFIEALRIFPYNGSARANLRSVMGALPSDKAQQCQSYLDEIARTDLDFVRANRNRPEAVYGPPVQVSMGRISFPVYLAFNDATISIFVRNTGSWELFPSFVLRNRLVNSACFFDIGANIGLYTVMAGLIMRDNPAARVFAFEPDEQAFLLLEHNCRLNNLSNVVAERLAVSDSLGTARLYHSDTNMGDHRLFQSEERSAFSTVEVTTIDDYCAQHDLRPDCLKIQAQGSESRILDGSRKSLDACRTVAPRFWPYGLAGSGVEDSRSFESLCDGYKASALVNDRLFPVDAAMLRASFACWRTQLPIWLDLLLTR